MIEPKSLRIGNTERNYKAMNNLEKELYNALKPADVGGEQLKAVFEICLREIRHAFSSGGAKMPSGDLLYGSFKDYLKAIELTPTEPDTKEDPDEYKRRFHSTVIGSNGIINGDYREDPGK